MSDEMSEFTVHHLRFEVEALTPLALPAYGGPAIRGALFGALRGHFCPAAGSEPPGVEHKAACPVCWLMATEKPDSRRGRDVPRPYTVEPPTQPPVDGRINWQPLRLATGERLVFGLTLFARALSLFPYLVVAMPLMGQAGIGLTLDEERGGRARRGRFVLRRIEAINPLTGVVAPVMGEGQTRVQMPDVPVTDRDVKARAGGLLGEMAAHQGARGAGRVQIRFRTPMRIVDTERLAHRPWLGPLVRRLLERLDALRGEFAGAPPVVERERLVQLADKVRLAQDFTRWVDLSSGSRRLGRTTPVGGFTGTAIYEADLETWAQLLPYLVWGQEIHVGKSATKGDGWYEVIAWPLSNT